MSYKLLWFGPFLSDLSAFRQGFAVLGNPICLMGYLAPAFLAIAGYSTRELWLQHCAARGQDTASVLRDCIYALVHGKTYRQMVVEKINHDDKRIDALEQLIGPFGAPNCWGTVNNEFDFDNDVSGHSADDEQPRDC